MHGLRRWKRDCPPVIKSLQQRFDEKYKVDPVSGCWLWFGAQTRGYGQISVGEKMFYAHRISYELHVGPIPKGLCILHRCDTPACVNFEHLWPGTTQDNTADRIQKGRQHGAAKLTEQQVLGIRIATGTQWEIASRYGIGQSQVSGIKNRKSWAHI